MSKLISARFSDEEIDLLERAIAIEQQLGDRGGPGVWLRRFALREAKKIVEEREGEDR